MYRVCGPRVYNADISQAASQAGRLGDWCHVGEGNTIELQAVPAIAPRNHRVTIFTMKSEGAT